MRDGAPRVLIACMGNVLRADDGFGYAVARQLERRDLPAGTDLIEVGIGGIHLVQQLQDGYDALVVVDAVDRQAEPGTVFTLRPRVPDLAPVGDDRRSEFLADMHYTVPSKALTMAKALGSLPARVWIVGCQPEDAERLGMELSPAVKAAVGEACARIERLVGGVAAAIRPAEDA